MPVRRIPALIMVAALVGCGHSSGRARSASAGTTGVTRTWATTTSAAPPAAAGTSSSRAEVVAPGEVPTHRAPTPAPTPTVRPPACQVGAQAPPPASIAADYATALAFAPDGRLFYAERSGTVRVFQDGAARVFATVSTVTTESGGGYSERGLLGVAIDPSFTQNRAVYAFYSDADRVHQDIVRWTDCGGAGGGPTVIIRLPSGPDCCHKGGRLAFGPDGKLYVTLGEERDAAAAQNVSDVRGKVLRYNPDGTVPADNPFGAGDPVWAYGLRNPFGIAFSSSGQLAVTNNGPSGEIAGVTTGFDTVVAAVARGSGYQWPYCYGYSHSPAGAAPGCGGQPGPDWSSEAPPSVVPTGAAFVDGTGPTRYAGHLVFCTFAAGMLILVAPQVVMAGPQACRLDVKQGPDHAIYYSDTTRIYRMA